MKQFLITILVLFLSATTCHAQVFIRKGATSVTKWIGANKAIIGANAVRGYYIEEQQRRQMAQNVARQAHQSTFPQYSAVEVKARSSALTVSSRLNDASKPVKIGYLNDSIILPVLPTLPIDTTSLVKDVRR